MEAFIQNNEIDESVDCWELTTIAWGYSYVDDFEVKDIMEKIKSGIEDRIDEMNINELLTSLRAYVVLKMESKLMVE